MFSFFFILARGREDKHIGVIRDINNSLLWDHVETMNSIPWTFVGLLRANKLAVVLDINLLLFVFVVLNFKQYK